MTGIEHVTEGSINDRAHQALREAAGDSTMVTYRAVLGDCAVGALAAGASKDEAMAISIAAHTDPAARDTITKQGGLIVGASRYLEGQLDG